MTELFKQRWGMNANAIKLGDEGKYKAALDLWKSPVQTLMNGLSGVASANVVVRLGEYIRRWGGITIYRPYESGDKEKRFWKNRNAAQHLKFLHDHQAPEWIWFQVGNEPSFDDGEKDVRTMSRMLADMIHESDKERLVVYNPSVGGFQKWWIEAGWYDEMLLALAENAHKMVDGFPQFMLGSHSTAYWHGIPAVHCAGRNPTDLLHRDLLKKESWPTSAQIFDNDTGDNWIVFRDWWFIERTRQLQAKHHINEGIDIQIVATEAGYENLPNLREQFPDVTRRMDEICKRETRGAPTIRPYLEWAFPDRSVDDSMCEDYWFIETRAPSLYRAFCAFTWSYHNDAPEKWDENYNMARVFTFIQRYPEFIVANTAPDTVPEPIPTPHPIPPSPGDSRYERAIFKSTGANTILREYPTVTSRELTRIVSDEVRFIPAEKLTDDEKHSDQLDDGTFAVWLPTVLHNLIGYVREDVVEIVLIPPTEPTHTLKIVPSPAFNLVAPVVINLHVESSFIITDFKWEFSDGTTSVGPRPMIHIPKGGDIIIKVTASNDIHSQTASLTLRIESPLVETPSSDMKALLRDLVTAIERQSDIIERLAIALEQQTELERHYLPKPASS